ncbi:MAG: transposase, partial [Bythopirellula sp.]|nr:transposase [Bythopirellula sp.]
DSRGWVEYRRGWQLPDPIRELEARARMSEDACFLTPAQRATVEKQICETCGYRGWTLHTVNCRSNHVHVVVTANVVNPKKIRIDLKAWTTRALKSNFDSTRENWWAERGSIRYLNGDHELQAAIFYVRDAQDNRH